MQTPSQTKSNNIVGISLVLLVMVLYFASQLLAPKLKKYREQVTLLKSEIALAQEKVDSFQTASSKVVELKDTIDRINLAVPAGRDVPGALTSLEAMAAKETVALKSSQPKPSNTVFIPTASGATSAGNSGNSLAFTLSLSTDYPHLTAFIKDVENNLRLMKVDSLIITPSDQNMLSVSMDVVTYSRDLTKE